MQVVLQRVGSASVSVAGEVVGRIGRGLVALVGVGRASTADDARWLAARTGALRLFADEHGRMNRSLSETGGEVLAISQFTLYADTSRGRRPSFVDAAPPETAAALYDLYCAALDVPVARGVFGAHMTIDMSADGPVTIRLERATGVARP